MTRRARTSTRRIRRRRSWYWDMIRDNIVSKGFDSFWADETEPDLPPNGSYFSIGPGTRYFNVYPLFHTAAIYDGFRRDLKTRALILSRDAYLGAQHNGTIFWSSDISPTWDTLKRQIPTGLDVTASGIAYWGNDIGGWQYLPAIITRRAPPLLDPSDARDNVGWLRRLSGAVHAVVRVRRLSAELPHAWQPQLQRGVVVWQAGGADSGEVSAAALPADAVYLFAGLCSTHETGAPFMRALFMDFPNDPKVAELGDEYMFGPALLVAPVTEQGATTKRVYLPAGADWYNYWTNERVQWRPDGSRRVRRSIRFRCLCGRGRFCRWERRWRVRRSRSDLKGARLSRGGCGLHALQRRRQDLCVREGREPDHASALGRCARRS